MTRAQEPITKNDITLIHTEGLDEEIRCAMCTNPIANDRGCNGSCTVNDKMYKKVMDTIENHIISGPTTTVSLEVYKQVAWERDIAIEQLHELGYEFGQKIEPTTKNDCAEQNGCIRCSLDDGDDCISREDVLQILWDYDYANENALVIKDIKALPSATPQEPRIDFEELKRKILMEVDGGTDDAWLAYGEVCNRINNSIDEFVADMRGTEE